MYTVVRIAGVALSCRPRESTAEGQVEIPCFAGASRPISGGGGVSQGQGQGPAYGPQAPAGAGDRRARPSATTRRGCRSRQCSSMVVVTSPPLGNLWSNDGIVVYSEPQDFEPWRIGGLRVSASRMASGLKDV